jgi:sugar transferase (PEP-CTERM system associated)
MLPTINIWRHTPVRIRELKSDTGSMKVIAPKWEIALPSGDLPGRPLRLRKQFLILGTGPFAFQVYEAMASHYSWWANVVGFLEEKPGRIGQKLMQSQVIGTYDQVAGIVSTEKIDAIVVCVEDRRLVLPVRELLESKAMGVEIIDGHRLYEEASGRLSIDSLRPSSLIFSTGFRQRWLSKTLKRSFDAVFAGIALTLLFPLIVMVAVLVKIDSPGPALYRQMRVGLRGSPYLIWKFRSMRNDAENAGPRWAEVNDPRVSRVGRWLRKLRIDEIPQLINVLRGEMSLVGPRPERPVFVQELRTIIPYYDIRHTVKPGITGWAQVKFRYGSSKEDAHIKLQYDLYYVKNLSFFLDMKILAHTIRVVLLGEGAQ